MPIYAYKCTSCGFAKDVLQKISDVPLEVCPSCGQSHFQKQVTAAGFQLKGSGWYVTDFRGNGSAGATSSTPAASDSGDSSASAAPAAESAKPATSAAGSAASSD